MDESVIVTRLGSIKNPKAVTHRTLAEVVREIRTSLALKSECQKLRDLSDAGDEAAYSTQKEKLPCALFAGKFAYANNAALETHSGLMVMDFDKLSPTEATALRHRLGNDPYTVLVFVSPSGRGVKWIVAIEATDKRSHSECWNVAAVYAQVQFAVSADPSGKDVSRKCFITHDPDAVFKETGSARSFQPANIANDSLVLGGIEVQDSQEVQGSQEISLSPSPPLGTELVAVERYLPDKRNANHFGFLWDLARYTRAVEKKHGKQFTSAQVDQIIERWYCKADPKFRPRTLGEYQDEFQSQLLAVRVPEGESGPIWETACARAKDQIPGFIAEGEFKSEGARTLAAFCFHLAAQTQWRFFLPQSKAGKHLGITQQAVHGTLSRFIRDGFLKKIENPTQKPIPGKQMANWYEWIGPREEIKPAATESKLPAKQGCPKPGFKLITV